MSVDIVLIVPFEPPSTGAWLDPIYRRTLGAYMNLPLSMATLELEAYVGRGL